MSSGRSRSLKSLSSNQQRKIVDGKAEKHSSENDILDVDLNTEHDLSFDIFMNGGTKNSSTGSNLDSAVDYSAYNELECCPVCLRSFTSMGQHIEVCGSRNGVVGERLNVLCQLHKVYLQKRRMLNFPLNFCEMEPLKFSKYKKAAPVKLPKFHAPKKKAPLFSTSREDKDDLIEQKIFFIVSDVFQYMEKCSNQVSDYNESPLWHIAGMDTFPTVNYYVSQLTPYIEYITTSETWQTKELIQYQADDNGPSTTIGISSDSESNNSSHPDSADICKKRKLCSGEIDDLIRTENVNVKKMKSSNFLFEKSIVSFDRSFNEYSDGKYILMDDEDMFGTACFDDKKVPIGSENVCELSDAFVETSSIKFLPNGEEEFPLDIAACETEKVKPASFTELDCLQNEIGESFSKINQLEDEISAPSSKFYETQDEVGATSFKSYEPQDKVGATSVKSDEPKDEIGASSVKSDEPQYEIVSTSFKSDEPKDEIGPSSVKSDEPQYEIVSTSFKSDEPKDEVRVTSFKSNEHHDEVGTICFNYDEPKDDVGVTSFKSDEPHDEVGAICFNSDELQDEVGETSFKSVELNTEIPVLYPKIDPPFLDASSEDGVYKNFLKSNERDEQTVALLSKSDSQDSNQEDTEDSTEKFPENVAQNSEQIIIYSSDDETDICKRSDDNLKSFLISSTPLGKNSHTNLEAQSLYQTESLDNSFWTEYVKNEIGNVESADPEEEKFCCDISDKTVCDPTVVIFDSSDSNHSFLEAPGAAANVITYPEVNYRPLDSLKNLNWVNYEDMDEDQLLKEMDKYGLKKSLGRRKGIILLKHIKNELDKREKNRNDDTILADDAFPDLVDSDLYKSVVEVGDEDFLKGGQLEVLSEYIKSDSELHNNLLKFKPVWLDDFQTLLKSKNVTISKAKLKKYSDYLGIIYREKIKEGNKF